MCPIISKVQSLKKIVLLHSQPILIVICVLNIEKFDKLPLVLELLHGGRALYHFIERHSLILVIHKMDHAIVASNSSDEASYCSMFDDVSSFLNF